MGLDHIKPYQPDYNTMFGKDEHPQNIHKSLFFGVNSAEHSMAFKILRGEGFPVMSVA